MPNRTCLVCGGQLFEEPLLRYHNMPKAAQNLPDADAVDQETGVDLTVFQCSGCGLVQLDCEPVAYYREVIRAAGLSQVIRDSKRTQFADLIERYSLLGKKIIEIGCGRGEFLRLLKPMDVKAYGLEFSLDAVDHCLRDGLAVSQGYLDDTTVSPEGPFDAFLLLMFLEHMPYPSAAFKGLHRNLSPGAIGLIEVPNFDMMLRDKLFSEFIPDHLSYFTADTLRTTLNLNGFDILESSELRDSYVLSVVVRKRGQIDVSDFFEYQARITTEIREHIDALGDKNVAIWGAGHQALAILALAGIGGRIRYVVDAAPFKHGKYTPATHVPIVHPDRLRTDPVDGVIVIAGSYSDEVVGILKARGDRPAISVLRNFGLEKIRD